MDGGLDLHLHLFLRVRVFLCQFSVNFILPILSLARPNSLFLLSVPSVVVYLFGTQSRYTRDAKLVRESWSSRQVKTTEHIVQGEASKRRDDIVLVLAQCQCIHAT